MQIDNLFSVDTRTYVAGILMPTISVQVNSAIGSLPTATVTLPPDPAFFGIGRDDRVPVLIFMRDTLREGGDTSEDGYVLIFEGEVGGFGYTSNAINKEVVISCHSILTILRDTKIKYLRTMQDMLLASVKGNQQSALHIGANQLVFPACLFLKGLNPLATDIIDTPSELLDNAVKLILRELEIPDDAISEKVEEYTNSVVAEFYKTYFEKIKMAQRYNHVPYFDEIEGFDAGWENVEKGFPLLKALQKNAQIQQVTKMNQPGPAEGSIYSLIDHVVSNVEYEFNFVAAPTFQPNAADQVAAAQDEVDLRDNLVAEQENVIDSIQQNLAAADQKVDKAQKTDDYVTGKSEGQKDADQENTDLDLEDTAKDKEDRTETYEQDVGEIKDNTAVAKDDLKIAKAKESDAKEYRDQATIRKYDAEKEIKKLKAMNMGASTIKSVQDKYDDAVKDIASADAQVTEQADAIEKLNEEISGNEERIADLKTAYDADIAELDTETAALEEDKEFYDEASEMSPEESKTNLDSKKKESADINVSLQQEEVILQIAEARAAEAAEALETAEARMAEDPPKILSCFIKPMLYEALPPRCNVMYRTHVEQLSTNEQIHQVPTRVRTKDLDGTLKTVTQGDGSVVTEYGIIDYYPTTHTTSAPSNSPGDPFTAELLDTEEFTGPYVHDTQAPTWLSYLSLKDLAETGADAVKKYKDQILKHMLLLRRYQGRRLSVALAINPYITPGYPGVVYDSEEADFAFIGQVLAVTHTFQKENVTTSVEMGFVRQLSDEAEGSETMLENSLSDISTKVTKDAEKMTDIYEVLLGCTAASISELEEAAVDSTIQDNPKRAFTYNARRLTTFREYLLFMDSIVAEWVPGLDIPFVLMDNSADGGFFSGRKDRLLRPALYEAAKKHFSKTIY